jgi:hypothetical protein
MADNSGNHAHLISQCRKCNQASTLQVMYSIDECNKFFNHFFETYTEMPEYIAFPITVRKYDNDLWRMQIKTHDIIVTSIECPESYDQCRMLFQQGQAMAALEERLASTLKGIGIDINTMPPEQLLDKLNEAMSVEGFNAAPNPYQTGPAESRMPNVQPMPTNRLNGLLDGIDFPADFGKS